jgi:transcriptional regulator with XRE-family HTH domain
MKFGPLLKQVRRQSGASQRTLAKNSKIDSTYLSKIENGFRNAPSRGTVIKISRVLKLNAEETDRLLLAADYAPINFFDHRNRETENNLLLTDYLYSEIRKKGMKAIYELINRPLGGAIVIKDNTILLQQIDTSPLKGVWAIPHGFINPKKGDRKAEDIAYRLVKKIVGRVKLKIVKELTKEGEVLENIDTTDYFMKLGLFPPIFRIYEVKINKTTGIKSQNALFIRFENVVDLPGLIHPLLYEIMQPYIKNPIIIKQLYDRGQETIQKLTDKRSFYLDMKIYAKKRISRIV